MFYAVNKARELVRGHYSGMESRNQIALANLRLTPTREAAIVEEIGAPTG